MDLKIGWTLPVWHIMGVKDTQASPVVLVVKNLLPMQETWETRFPSLGQGDPLEEGTATHSSIIAWRIPWTEEPGGLQSMVSQRVGYD